MPRPSLGLRGQLLILLLLIIVPLLVFTGGAVFRITQLSMATAHQSLELSAQTMSLAIDRKLETYMAVLAAFGTSPALDRRDDALLYAQAEAIARQHGVWIAVAEPSGQQIVNTLALFGAELPPSHPVTVPKEPPQDGVVHNLFPGPVARKWIAGMTLPVRRSGEIICYLHLGLSAEHLRALLEKQGLPEGWFAALVDGDDKVVARVPPIGWRVGETVPVSLEDTDLGAGTGVREGVVLGDIEASIAVERLAVAPWSIVVGLPQADLDEAWQRPLGLLAGGGMVTILAASLVLFIIASKLTRSLEGLAAAARAALQETSLPPVPRSRIRQFALLRDAVIELSQKQMLLREVNHRIKNSLQIVATMLRLQGTKTASEEVRTQLTEARMRVMAIAKLHERFYMADRYRQIDASELIEAVCADIVAICADWAVLRPDIEPGIRLSASAAEPFALIVAELITNAMKHARRRGRPVEIGVRCRLEDGSVLATISDDGPGLPPEFRLDGHSGLGLGMCLALAKQIGGTLQVGPSEKGAAFELRIPAGAVRS